MRSRCCKGSHSIFRGWKGNIQYDTKNTVLRSLVENNHHFTQLLHDVIIPFLYHPYGCRCHHFNGDVLASLADIPFILSYAWKIVSGVYILLYCPNKLIIFWWRCISYSLENYENVWSYAVNLKIIMDGFMNYCPFISIDGLLHLSILVLFKSFPISHCADSVHTRMNYRMPVAFWLGTGTLHSVICCAMSICANAGSTLVQQHAEY